MVGKKFTSLLDGKIVEVKDAFEDIIILNDNSKLKASRLLDKSYFEEYIDPASFFQNESLLNSFAQKIKQIPNEVLNNMEEKVDTTLNESLKNPSFNPIFEESAVLPADPEVEKEELMRKYGIKNKNAQTDSPQIEAQRQMERFQALLSDPIEEVEEVQKIEVVRDTEVQEQTSNLDSTQKEIIVEKPVEVDPIISMFRNVKRNNDFKISIDIENKIPRSDFIEMMEDSYNTSIIDFLAEEFTQKILDNPNLIKEKISNEIKNIVYNKKTTSTKETTITTPKKPRAPRQKKQTEK